MINLDLSRTTESKNKTKYSLNYSLPCYALFELPLIVFLFLDLQTERGRLN